MKNEQTYHACVTRFQSLKDHRAAERHEERKNSNLIMEGRSGDTVSLSLTMVTYHLQTSMTLVLKFFVYRWNSRPKPSLRRRYSPKKIVKQSMPLYIISFCNILNNISYEHEMKIVLIKKFFISCYLFHVSVPTPVNVWRHFRPLASEVGFSIQQFLQSLMRQYPVPSTVPSLEIETLEQRVSHIQWSWYISSRVTLASSSIRNTEHTNCVCVAVTH
jgi:hypothetical protein